jgi:hypothetical protein
MRELRGSILAVSALLAAVAVASAQTGGGSSGGSSGGGSSAGGTSSGSVSGGASRGGSTASGTRGSSGTVQSPSLRIQSPSANTSTRPSVHPSQRTDPSIARSKERTKEEQEERQERQILGSGGTPSGGARGSAAGDSNAGESQAGGSLLNLTAAQREKVRRVIRTYSITPSDNANFQWRPGALVPANVSLRPLPADLKDIIPDYQNFSYVMAGNRIAIVITEKREIDLVISG